jgi:hypothetical protein
LAATGGLLWKVKRVTEGGYGTGTSLALPTAGTVLVYRSTQCTLGGEALGYRTECRQGRRYVVDESTLGLA